MAMSLSRSQASLDAEAQTLWRAYEARVDAERDRRIEAGFNFAGNRYDFDVPSKSRITGAGALAGIAVTMGAVAGNLRWRDPNVDFMWVASDNTFVPMDAQTCFALAARAADHESAHIFAARALKDAAAEVEDITDDQHWP